MTEWHRCTEFSPPERDILVWGVCGMPHVALWRESHCHSEACLFEGDHFSGGDIAFTHWAELPKPPED